MANQTYQIRIGLEIDDENPIIEDNVMAALLERVEIVAKDLVRKIKEGKKIGQFSTKDTNAGE